MMSQVGARKPCGREEVGRVELRNGTGEARHMSVRIVCYSCKFRSSHLTYVPTALYLLIYVPSLHLATVSTNRLHRFIESDAVPAPTHARSTPYIFNADFDYCHFSTDLCITPSLCSKFIANTRSITLLSFHINFISITAEDAPRQSLPYKDGLLTALSSLYRPKGLFLSYLSSVPSYIPPFRLFILRPVHPRLVHPFVFQELLSLSSKTPSTHYYIPLNAVLCVMTVVSTYFHVPMPSFPVSVSV